MLAMMEGFDIEMTLEQARSASHPGPCDEDVVAELMQIPTIRRQFKKLLDVELRDELRSTGAWTDEELADRAANEARVLWLAAGQITEGAAERGRKG